MPGGGYASSGFEIGNVLDARSFPAARRNRTGPPPSAGLGAAAPGGVIVPPRSRVFPFVLGAGNAQRSSVSSPRLLGPVVLKGLYISKTGAAGNVRGIGLGKATAPVTENNVAAGTPLPFTALFEGLPAAGGAAASPDQTDMSIDSASPLYMPDSSMNFIITDTEFFLVVYNAAQGATAGQINGHVNLLEQVSLDVLPFVL